MTEINWTGPEDDQTAKVGNYILRIEYMDQGTWWWACYYSTIEYGVHTIEAVGTGDRSSLDLAKSSAIRAMEKHKNETT